LRRINIKREKLIAKNLQYSCSTGKSFEEDEKTERRMQTVSELKIEFLFRQKFSTRKKRKELTVLLQTNEIIH
jgi:hypothetical protein